MVFSESPENVLVHDLGDVIVKTSVLRAIGVRFSLDGFGIGYSILSYLKRLPLDQLKIDHGFDRDVLSNPNDAAILKTIIALAENQLDAVMQTLSPQFRWANRNTISRGKIVKNVSMMLCALSLPAGVYAETFQIATDSYPPYTTTESAKVGGMFTEIVDAAFKQTGNVVQYVVAPWARSSLMTEAGGVAGTIPWAKTPEREAIFVFSEPIGTATAKIFIKKDGKVPENLDWKSFADFKPYRFGGTIGNWYIEGFNKAGVPLDLVPKDEQNVQKLESGRIDAFISNELVGWTLIKKWFPGQEGQFATLHKPALVAPMFVMAGKKAPDSAKFIGTFNEGLKKIQGSGEYDKIVARYR